MLMLSKMCTFSKDMENVQRVLPMSTCHLCLLILKSIYFLVKSFLQGIFILEMVLCLLGLLLTPQRSSSERNKHLAH